MVNLGRFRRRQQQLNLSLTDKPSRERHFLSITSSVLSGILLILALVLPEWAKGSHGDCSYKFGLTKVEIAGGNSPGIKDSQYCVCVCVCLCVDCIYISISFCSGSILQPISANTDIVYIECVCPHSHLDAGGVRHQSGLPPGEGRVPTTLRCLQHCLV